MPCGCQGLQKLLGRFLRKKTILSMLGSLRGFQKFQLPIAPPRVDSNKGPHRVNRAHWPTRENRQNFSIFWIFPAYGKNCLRWPQIGPGGFFPTNPDLADILGRTDLNFEKFVFFIFWTPNFQTPPPPPPPTDEPSDPNLTPLPTHPGIKYVARALAAIFFRTNPDLANILGDMDFDFDNLCALIF